MWQPAASIADRAPAFWWTQIVQHHGRAWRQGRDQPVPGPVSDERTIVAVFKASEVLEVGRFSEGGPGPGPGPAGSVIVASFNLFGQQFSALNGGPQFNFTESVSFLIDSSSQDEVDSYWDALFEGGESSRCG